MKTITIELSEAGCKAALKEIRKYQRSIKRKMDKVCKRLAEIGRDTAINIVDQVRQSEGNFVDSIEVVQTDNGYKIVMAGEDVYFIEFGTGDGVEPHYDTSVPVAWGTWSAEHNQVLWKHGFWYYEGQKFTGTPAYMPMYYAEKAMREAYPKVAQEVFKTK